MESNKGKEKERNLKILNLMGREKDLKEKMAKNEKKAPSKKK